MGDKDVQDSNVKNELDIVVVGSCMIDLVSYVSRLPVAGETINGHKFKQGFGGKGANQCVAAAKLGACVGLIAKLGNDSFGTTYLNDLAQYKTLNTKFVDLVPNQTTGMASISVADNGENQIVVVPGANSSLAPSDIDRAKDCLLKAKIVVFQGETPWDTTLYCLNELAGTSGFTGKTIVNAAPAPLKLNSLLPPLVDIFCVNELEAETLTSVKIASPQDAILSVDKLLSMNFNTVIITLGGNGVAFASKNETTVQTVQVDRVDKPVDTTGAGDCFVGCLSYFLCYFPELPLGEIIARSCQIARLSVLECGTQESFPSEHILEKKLFSKHCQFYRKIEN